MPNDAPRRSSANGPLREVPRATGLGKRSLFDEPAARHGQALKLWPAADDATWPTSRGVMQPTAALAPMWRQHGSERGARLRIYVPCEQRARAHAAAPRAETMGPRPRTEQRCMARVSAAASARCHRLHMPTAVAARRRAALPAPPDRAG